MSDNLSRGKATKVREIFVEDYDQDVLDYQSGLRRQALRAQRDADGPVGSRHDLLIIHVERTPPADSEASRSNRASPSTSPLYSSEFESHDLQDSGKSLAKLTEGLKRLLNKTSIAQSTKKSLKKSSSIRHVNDRNNHSSQISQATNTPDRSRKRCGFYDNKDLKSALKDQLGVKYTPPE